jgi:type V secretory pathway adhesin AidA
MSFAQGQSINEDFVNETSFLYVQARPFKLAAKSLPFISFPIIKSQLQEELKLHLPDSTVETLMANAAADSIHHTWVGSLLDDVQVVNKAQTDTLLGAVIIVSEGESQSAYKKKVRWLESKRGVVYFLSHPVLTPVEILR